MANLAARILVWLFLERRYPRTGGVRVTWTNYQMLLIATLVAVYFWTR